jgi:hypothetical protein
MTPPTDQIDRWIASLLDRTGGQLRAELDVLVDQVRDAARAEQGVSARSPGIQQTSPAHGDESLAADAPAARTGQRQAEVALASAVVEAMTALDSAGSLSDILDVLVDRAAEHTGRVLLVVRRADALTGWRWRGYTPDPHDARMLEIRLDDQGLVARAAKTGRMATGTGPAAGDDGDGAYPENRAAIAAPLLVDGRVVAVVYADQDRGDNDDVVRGPWPEVIEVLARHAARCLESMTARRLPQLVRALAAGEGVAVAR